MRELAEFIPEAANTEEYLCSKFKDGLNLKVQEKMSVSSNHGYKEVMQLALRVEKLTSVRLAKGKFQKRKVLVYVQAIFEEK